MSGRKNQKAQHSSKEACIFEKGINEEGKQYSIPYYLIRELGRGGFAKCYSTTIGNNKDKVAVKIFDKSSNRSHNILKIENQIEIMSSLHHQGIVKFIHRFQNQKQVYMIMELCTKGSLDQVMKQREYLTQPEVRYIIFQLVSVLIYLKSQNIIHRDIKMGNIFISQDYKVKIGDFGLSTHVSNSLMKKNVCGTPNYIAPEVINKQEYGCQVDVWSTGILIHTLLIGRPPFEGKNVKHTYSRILKCELNLNSKNVHISKMAKSFLESLIVSDRQKRMKLQEILKHPFMSKFDIPKRLEPHFEQFYPSQTFFERYNKQKSKQFSLDPKSTSSASYPLSFLSTQKKTSSHLTMKEFQTSKNEINLLETSSICYSSQEEKNHELKRQHSQTDLFGETIKKFRKNIESRETRGGIKKRLELLQIQKKVKEVCQKTKVIQTTQIRNLFQIDSSSKETFLSIFDSILRIIYFNKHKQTNTMTYLTNHYLMGIIFPDESSIIYHLRFKKTFHLSKKDGSISAVELKCDLRPEECDNNLKDKIILFVKEHRTIKEKLKTDGKLSSELLGENLEPSVSFSFVQNFIQKNNTTIFQVSNGDLTCLYKKETLFVISTLRNKIMNFKQGQLQSITNTSTLTIETVSKLKIGCDLILKMLDKKQGNFQESIVERIENKERLFYQITVNRKIKTSDLI